ncbi:DUF1643 domain-containing protein [Neobacillus sp. PS2-9]|uniref:DUF1643 domain-containing protein n=1 Tax=Neobacillus sp. PS2-9 TaxID=3070676 RepID=UPI0027E12439|nr:DUF1643 domain-containing protein [Neobacillus sp. PS2-9]WML56502.1 DUF1643 domain-containing protein [Neobacillus sp. PS2-9]
MQNHSYVLPSCLPSPINVGSGIAVFHSEYSLEHPHHSTYRRYFLSRCWDNTLPIMTFFGMNPSTASSCSNDDTVEFMIKVAKYNGFGSLFVVNTSPYIKSGETKKEDFVVDNETWEYIQFAVQQASLVVLAWGGKGQKYGIPTLTRDYPLRDLLAANSENLRLFEWGGLSTTQKFPKHPLQRDPFSKDHKLLTFTLDDFNAIIPRSNKI